MRNRVKAAFFPITLLLLYLGAQSQARAVTVFRDRAAFTAAAQNLNAIDFEGATPPSSREHFLDGIRFESQFGFLFFRSPAGPTNTVLHATGVGEITHLRIDLPPGTTAVGCELFSRSVSVTTSSGGGVTVGASDTSDFVGFTSDVPIGSLFFLIDFPEPTDDVKIDNLTFGQRAGDAQPAPLLFVAQGAGGAAALDSVTHTPSPFRLTSPHNFSADGRTRLSLFLAGVRLEAADAPQVTVRLEDSQGGVFDVTAEAVTRARGLSWLSQVNFLLPADLAPGDATVTVRVRGAASNPATLRIEAPAN